jgi:hypothetical protein
MAKSKKKSKQDDASTAQKAAEQAAAAKRSAAKAKAKAAAKAAAKLAALVDEAKKARKAADKAVRSADTAQAAATAAGAPSPKRKPDEAALLKLALRSAEAKLTDAERKVEALERQIADFHTLDDQVIEEAIEDAVVDAAVEATVVEAVVDAQLVADALPTDVDEAEVVTVIAAELDEIVEETRAEVAAADAEPDHRGEAADAAAVFAGTDAAAEPTVTTSELTPPLPDTPADDQPSESWTLLRLRAAAKSRGLTGTSNLPKAALLDRLRS